MVRLEEVEDESFVEKPESSRDDVLLVDDDADYTDTDSELSDASDVGDGLEPDESIADRINALKDIVPPQTRAKLSNIASKTYSTTSKAVLFSGKGLWVGVTSLLLLGLPYFLAFAEEQMVLEEERQRQLMTEGASGLLNAGQEGGQAKASL